MTMGWFEHNKPLVVIIVLQFTYAMATITTRASLLEQMNPRVFVVYRQTIATLFISPISYFLRSKTKRCSLGWRSFSLIFVAALIGVTTSQMFNCQGLYLASSSASSAMSNLSPAITFIVASIVGYEQINIRSLRTIAKISGTVLCVTSATVVAFIKGPKLLNAQFSSTNSLLLNSAEKIDNSWVLGCLYLFISSCCWSFLLIIQVPITKYYPDHLSLSAWMSFIAMLQSAIVTMLTGPHLEAWKCTSYVQLGSCLYSGIVGSGITVFLLAWVIERRGPVFSAMFTPLNTVIVTILASIFLQEQLYLRGLIGIVGILIGLYVVLWGKAKDLQELKEEQEKKTMMSQNNEITIIQVLIDDNNLVEPLL